MRTSSIRGVEMLDTPSILGEAADRVEEGFTAVDDDLELEPVQVAAYRAGADGLLPDERPEGREDRCQGRRHIQRMPCLQRW